MGALVRTELCELLGIEYPIICAPMGPDITGPELVAAVSNAGGLGILQAGQSVGLINDIKPASEIVRELAEGL